ncbi:hypothetical protein LT85_0314 [Collimonas arenae]|uniref:Cysteine protease n=1 Tax=Collimonas arenae TaxID=279058 RepID=A0A0A1F709_9BURK|nr:DUF3857 domain-containing transglutaminase family protein [Collimonas arenae]AIY39474.1 hypothetical protein LT85_0314 [Collimonas arenae]
MQRFPFYRPLICTSLGLATSTVFAAYQPTSEAPLASDFETRCHFNSNGSTDCVETYQYTILKPNGREMLSRIDFNYPETDKVELIRAESIQPGGKPIPLAASQIDTRTAPNPDQGFSRKKQTSLAFPNLKEGTRISYSVRIHYAAQPGINGFHHVLTFAPNPVRRDAYKASFSAEQPIQWRSELMDGFTITPSSDRKELVVEQNKATYVNYINEADNAYIRLIPRLELGNSLDIQHYFGDVASRYNQIVGAALPAKSAAAVAALHDLSVERKVSGLMQHINDNYRYLGDWRASDRGYLPFSLAQIEQHGYGDCKDLSVLLAAMLKASGISADVAWVSRGDVARSLLIPGTAAPNHAIVRAVINGQVWWLDPTNPVFDPGQTLPDIQDRWVMVIDSKGMVREEHIPLQSPATSIGMNKRVHFEDSGKARISADIDMRALPAVGVSVADRQQGASSTDQDLCNNFGKEITDCAVTREASGFVVPKTYKIKVKLTDLRPLEKMNGDYFYTAEALREKWSDLINYRRNGQLADLYMGNPETTVHEITLSGGKLDKDIQSCQVRSPWYDMDLRSERVKGDYRYHYTLTQKMRWLSHDEIVSAPFETMINEARSCGEQLHQVVKFNG